ncbi:APC family permease [Streptomyces lunaelactis]|nr:APC family permease [Streptomyces lunaelactis]NUK02029.1 APC family permease [Streptomyces lunaelactis]NUK08826.1 APC family permease [Streptomyces lunaelactis]NUK15934.1 APC family permease [Streptomyces lunaelactis]NUK23807.1 APC family permease [Streptomyces lunaelactis]NUK57657.1 APC family permease [Streptomyces lunaelactis]
MLNVTGILKRLVIGRAMRSEELGGTLLPKRLALPIFASDPLSSVAYATQEILLVLTLGGLAYLHFTPWIAGAVVALMTVVVLSYRQVVHAYPSGGGSYEVASTNLGPSAGLVVAASLLVDYVMTVAVSVASGVDNIISALPSLVDYRVLMALIFVALLTAMNLRGVRESGQAFAAPTYLFIGGVLIMVGTGLFRYLVGDAPVAESAAYGIEAEPGDVGLTGLALVMLVLRAFSSGCTALTGVEAISNGVPAFRKPKSQNAATTMAVMGIIAITMFVGVTTLAIVAKVHIVEDACRLTGLTGDCDTYTQRTVIAQLAASVFGGENSFGFYFIQAATALVLILAANTAYNGFPLLASILAQHRYLPRQLHNRGDRLAFSNGILALAVVAGALLWAYKADVTSLIHLYILGVFTSFTLSQTGMVRHWNRELRTETDPVVRRRHQVARVINSTGAVVTCLVLVIVLATKFTQGAWLAVLAAIVLWVMMRGIRRHYDSTAAELAVTDPRSEMVPPSRVLAIVLVSTIHKPTLRALAYARAFRPDQLVALTVAVDRDQSLALQRQWEEYQIPVPLKILDSPYREITGSVLEYVRSIRRESPRDVIAVFIPEYVVGHWWENLLHNQSALWLKSRLLFTPGVMVTSVPWQLSSSAIADHPAARAPGSVRRGEPVKARTSDDAGTRR